MKARAWPRIEPLALIAATLATAMAVYYVWLIHQQGNQPLPWVLALLLAGALLAVYGSIRQVPYRRAALLAAGLALIALGLLALPSVGLPIIVSGLLALAASRRAAPQRRAP
jgi:peptidoglycan/LPS O-acetylase OafA/YrhL